MYAYIKGILDTKGTNFVIVEAGGVGYKIFMSTKAIDALGEVGSNVKVYTHYYVREDLISLYGFVSNEELRMFELLISVSGIGAKSAIAMLSAITPSSFALAVISNDVSQLVKIPGIGSKTAQRIILELKDKLKTEQAVSESEEIVTAIKEDNKNSELIAALQVLGYTRKEIEKVIEKMDVNSLSLEDAIKRALVLFQK